MWQLVNVTSCIALHNDSYRGEDEEYWWLSMKEGIMESNELEYQRFKGTLKSKDKIKM